MNDIIEKIESVIRSPGFFYSYLVLIRFNLFLPEWKILKINHYEKLNFQEMSFITWLLIKNEIDLSIIPNESKIKEDIEKMYKLLSELHAWFIREVLYSEPIFYWDSWVYDFQYVNFTNEVYSCDNEWLKKNKKIELNNVVWFRKRKSQTIYDRINDKKQISSLVDLAEKTLQDLSFKKNDIPTEYMQYFKNFSCKPKLCNKDYSHPMEFNQFEASPFIEIDDFYLLPISFLLAKALYTTPFYRIWSDIKYYNSIWQNNRWKASEAICLSLTEEIVGKKNSYKNVIIKDWKGNHVTEIDTLLIIWNRAIIIQAKSKKMTELAKKWNIQKIEKDFQEAIQDAYNQWLKCRRAIINKTHSLRIEWKQIELNESIVDAYILCVTLDYYPSVILQSKFFLEHDKEDPFPICISIFDLEIICHYLKNKFDFLFYLHQRTKYWDQLLAESEIALLWLHLNQKLRFEEDQYDLMNIGSDFWALIDVHFPVEKWWTNKTPEYENLYSKRSNPIFNSIILKIIDTNQSNYTDAILFLYSLWGECIDNIINMIESIKEKTRKDGKVHDCSMLFGKKWITIKVFPTNHHSDMSQELLHHAMARKYKSKADFRLWFGFYINSNAVIDSFCCWNFAREEDNELQALTKIYLNPNPKVVDEKLNRIKIWRNSLCPCWSWKKYKKCCLDK